MRTLAAIAIGLGLVLSWSNVFSADGTLPELKKMGSFLQSWEYRSIDGRGNNLDHPEWGGANSELRRHLFPADYEDGVSSPVTGFPNPRAISNEIVAQPQAPPNAKSASNFIWQWGQFIDHDITLSFPMVPAEIMDIPVPMGDPFFDPLWTGTQVICFSRAIHSTATGVRQQVNEITAYIDASTVYGSNPVRARELRALDGSGRLKTSPGRLLPFNVNGLRNEPGPDPAFFLAGDIRANEQIGLTSMHTLFLREHNAIARRMRAVLPGSSGDEIYSLARAVVGAEIQVITYSEFLPMLLGTSALEPYTGYKPDVDPGIENGFSAAAYRVGHTLITSRLLRLKHNGRSIPEGDIGLRDGFFNPRLLQEEGGIEPVLRGLAAMRANQVDPFIVDDLRNFLFGPPGEGGFDLASLNIQRGRDHGLPRYNACRVAMGLPAKTGFSDVSSDPLVRSRLASVYDSVDDIDLWVGGLSEDHVPGAMVGETLFHILKNQFERLRDGDRFWYQNYFSEEMTGWLEQQTLAGIIRRNTSIANEIPDHVFVFEEPAGELAEAQASGGGSLESLVVGDPAPNPVRSGAPVGLALSAPTGDAVSVSVYDLRGRLIRSLHRGPLSPGEHMFHWDGRDLRGLRAPSGIYFMRIQGQGLSAGRKLVVMN